ncbi:MAG: protein kinase [Nannocystaceae bacterium]
MSADPSMDRMGHYELITRLAAGGMGEVFVACRRGEQGFHRTVAVKRIRPQFSSDSEFIRMFLNEARLASRLDHPNIVHVQDFGRSGDDYYMVMEYLHGASLLELVRASAQAEQAFPLDHALTAMAGLLAGLHHAHELSDDDGRPLEVVHRDVSPGNVMVTYDGEVKVLDFGIARATQATQTAQGTRKGKVQYMSPEQCHGLAVDRRSDVFAAGIVLYELSTMTRPFRGDNEFAVMNAIVAGRLRPPSEVVESSFDPALERLILRALATDPEDRFQTARQMMLAVEEVARASSAELSTRALGAFAESVTGGRPWPSMPPPSAVALERPRAPAHPAPQVSLAPPPRALRSRGRWVPPALAGVAVLGVGGWLLLPQDPEAPGEPSVAAPRATTAIEEHGEASPPVEPARPPTPASPPSQVIEPAKIIEPAAPAEASPLVSDPNTRKAEPKRRRKKRRDSEPAPQPRPSRQLRGFDGLLPSKQ